MNLTPSMGVGPVALAALELRRVEAMGQPQAEPPKPPPGEMAAVSVDIDALLMTLAIGAKSPAMRAKAYRARQALTQLIQEARGAAAVLEATGRDHGPLAAAVDGVIGRPTSGD
jgi:hypothetical protein